MQPGKKLSFEDVFCLIRGTVQDPGNRSGREQASNLGAGIFFTVRG